MAEALGRLGAPSHSVERVVALIDEAAASSQHDLPFACFWIERAVRFLGKHDRARGARVVLALLGGSSKARGWGLAFARHVPAPDVIAALVAHLEDQAPTGRRLWSGYEVRVCDAAAEALAALLGVADRFKLQGDASQRDKGITALRAHCAAAGEDRAR